jgi:hypothetical protein
VRERYWDFGPTFAREKLVEEHGFAMSVETLRQWMIADGLWHPKQKKQQLAFQMRLRRPRVGELIQIDGSPHDWFEGRAPECTLIVFIDDASSRLMDMRFVPSETTEAYMGCLKRYLARYGHPVSFYSDKHSVFRVNQEDAESGEQLTQFGGGIENTGYRHHFRQHAQAKHTNQTLQRLAGISGMEEGNAFLKAWMEKYNRRFAVQPACDIDAHRPAVPQRPLSDQGQRYRLRLARCHRHGVRRLHRQGDHPLQRKGIDLGNISARRITASRRRQQTGQQGSRPNHPPAKQIQDT